MNHFNSQCDTKSLISVFSQCLPPRRNQQSSGTPLCARRTARCRRCRTSICTLQSRLSHLRLHRLSQTVHTALKNLWVTALERIPMTNTVFLTPKPEKRKKAIKSDKFPHLYLYQSSLGMFGVCISWCFLSTMQFVFFHVSDSY